MTEREQLQIYVNKDTGTVLVLNEAFNPSVPMAVDYMVYAASSGGTAAGQYPCFGRHYDYEDPNKGSGR